jgi:putative CocE/NonD family hydrolase
MSFEPCFSRPDTAPNPTLAVDGCRLLADVPIPMRDGIRLSADLYLPPGDGPFPVLLERTPYGKHQSVMVNIGAPQHLARNGYVVAIQDVRGCYASEGEWYPFGDDLPGPLRDGHDSIEWLASQPFSNDKIGTFGGSYAGMNQYTLAADMPPHLAAAFPRQGPSGLHGEWVYRGGALEFAFLVPRLARRLSIEALRNRHIQFVRRSRAGQMDLATGWPLPDRHFLFSDPFLWIKEYLARQTDEEYWQKWSIEPHYGAFDRPAFHVASWFDVFCGGTLKNFSGMRAAARSPEIRRNHRMIIGPWIHGPFMDRSPQGRLAGDMDFGPQSLWGYNTAMQEWFDHWLKGEENAAANWPAVRYFVMGSNQWREADDWPPAGIEYRRFYFRSEQSDSAHSLHDGSLSATPAPGAAGPVRFTHDPDKPVATLGGATLFNLSPNESTTAESWDDLNAQAGSRDQRPIENQCVTFTSAPLESDLLVTGPVKALVFFSSSAVDTDLVIRLCDVYPDGRSMLLCDGIQRASFRDSSFRQSLLDPGSTYQMEVDLWATSNLFRAGHRIRVVVNSSSFPRFDVNPGTGESGLRPLRKVKAENCVFVDSIHPSRIVLPVMG